MHINITVTDAKTGRVLSSTSTEVEVPVPSIKRFNVEREVPAPREMTMEEFARRGYSAQQAVEVPQETAPKARAQRPATWTFTPDGKWQGGRLPDFTSLAERIAWYLDQTHMSAAELADTCGIPRSTLYGWLAGKGEPGKTPLYKSARKISDATNLPSHWLRRGR